MAFTSIVCLPFVWNPPFGPSYPMWDLQSASQCRPGHLWVKTLRFWCWANLYLIRYNIHALSGLAPFDITIRCLWWLEISPFSLKPHLLSLFQSFSYLLQSFPLLLGFSSSSLVLPHHSKLLLGSSWPSLTTYSCRT